MIAEGECLFERLVSPLCSHFLRRSREVEIDTGRRKWEYQSTGKEAYSGYGNPSREEKSWVLRAAGEVEDPGCYVRVDGVDGEEADKSSLTKLVIAVSVNVLFKQRSLWLDWF